MIHEHSTPLGYVITLICDSRGCGKAESALHISRDDCNYELFARGWRLNGKKHMCPACTERYNLRRGKK